MATALMYVGPRVDPVAVVVQELLWSLLLAVGLVVAVLVAPVVWAAMAPVAGKLLIGAAVIGAYAVVFQPKQGKRHA